MKSARRKKRRSLPAFAGVFVAVGLGGGEGLGGGGGAAGAAAGGTGGVPVTFVGSGMATYLTPVKDRQDWGLAHRELCSVPG